MDESSLLELAARAARELVQDLEQGERITNRWEDPDRSFPWVQKALDRCLDALSNSGCWGEVNRLPSSRFWSLAGSWLQVGALQWHARSKPRGYAGDFELLEKICTGWVGDHPLGRLFDRYFQMQQAPEAVRNRTNAVAAGVLRRVRQSTARPLHIVSFGSGAALDLRAAAGQLSDAERGHLQLSLLDLDPTALEQARERLTPFFAPASLRCGRDNLFRLPRGGVAVAWLRDVDFLACPGLFDYLSQPDATAMLARFWQVLNPGGRLLVFQFGPMNTSRAYMEWIGNWYLIYRDAAAMRAIADAAGIPSACTCIATEPSGANLYWDIGKPL